MAQGATGSGTLSFAWLNFAVKNAVAASATDVNEMECIYGA